MRVHIAADHAGFELKTHLIAWLTDHGHEAVDHGAHAYDAEDDYPPFCISAAAAAVAEPNKVKGARAALAWSIETASLARQHNDAQVVAIGARMHTADEATAIVEAFLTTPWSHAERHQRRIDMLLAYEETGELA